MISDECTAATRIEVRRVGQLGKAVGSRKARTTDKVNMVATSSLMLRERAQRRRRTMNTFVNVGWIESEVQNWLQQRIESGRALKGGRREPGLTVRRRHVIRHTSTLCSPLRKAAGRGEAHQGPIAAGFSLPTTSHLRRGRRGPLRASSLMADSPEHVASPVRVAIVVSFAEGDTGLHLVDGVTEQRMRDIARHTNHSEHPGSSINVESLANLRQSMAIALKIC